MGRRNNSVAWQRAYRSLDHGGARQICRRKQEIRSFPREIRAFAQFFFDLQDERHGADYDPFWPCFKSDVADRIADARVVIERLEAAPIHDRRAFAARVLFKRRS